MEQPEHEPPCLQAGLFPFDVVIHTVDSATALGYSLNTSDVSLGMQSLYSKAQSVIVGCLHVPLLPVCLHPPVHPHPPCSHHQPLRRLPPAAALDPACRPGPCVLPCLSSVVSCCLGPSYSLRACSMSASAPLTPAGMSSPLF